MTKIRIERYDPETGKHTIHKVSTKRTRSDNIGFKADYNNAVCSMIINDKDEVLALVKPYVSAFDQATGKRISKRGTWMKVARYEEYMGVGGVAFFGPDNVQCLWAKSGRQTVKEFMAQHSDE